MSPAAQAVAIPTRTEIEAWTTSHLADAASAWRGAAAASEDAFDQHRQNINSPGGTTWEGDAKDAALDRVARDTAVVGSQNETLLAAADTAENGVTDINAAQREVIAAITAAEADGFRVGEDLSVTDTCAYDLDTAAARATAATEHAEDIRWTAERLAQADNLAGQQLQAKAAELEGIRFDGEGDSRDPTIRMVDHDVKLNPPVEPDDDQWLPHPDYPGRSRNGRYNKDNSRDGAAAAKAALDKRQKDTGIELIRQEVRATHPDVIHENGQPQHRYYDALEPTGYPDEYIGIEAKTNKGALRTDQQTFDAAVSPERPAKATLNGREITIIGAEVEYPPKGWVPPSAQNPDASLAPSPPAAGAGPGPSSSGSGLPVTGPAPAPASPNPSTSSGGGGGGGGSWGSDQPSGQPSLAPNPGTPYLTPEQRESWREMGPPFEFLEPYMPRDPNDPDNHA